MEIINTRKRKKIATWSLIGGIGALLLSFAWLHFVNSDDLSGPVWTDSIFIGYTLWYYLINSALLISVSVLMKKGFYRIHAYLSILLAFSVFSSLLIVDGSSNLFAYTTLFGLLAFIYGGTIIVPLFLWSVIRNFVIGIKYFVKKVEYRDEIKSTNA